MDLKEAFAIAATVGFLLAITCWPAWFIFKRKSAETRSALLSQYAEILRQLDDLTKLEEEFNTVCAERFLGARIDGDSTREFLVATQTAFNKIESAPDWKVLFRYPKYWHLAEVYARHIAPIEGQLRDTIGDIQQASAA
jgi:hypothetical protein